MMNIDATNVIMNASRHMKLYICVFMMVVYVYICVFMIFFFLLISIDLHIYFM